MRNSVLIALTAVSVGLAATPASAFQSADSQVKKAKPAAEKKICRWLPVTGSNMNQRVCLTADEWKKAESQAW